MSATTKVQKEYMEVIHMGKYAPVFNPRPNHPQHLPFFWLKPKK